MWILYSDSIQAAQKGPDARPQLNRGARNEAYSSCTSLLPRLDKQMGLFQQPRQLMRNLSLSIRLNLGPYTMSNTCSLPGKSLIANSFNAATCPEASSTDIPGLPMMSITVKSTILLRWRIRLSSSFSSFSVGSLSPWVIAAPLRLGHRARPAAYLAPS